jgi:hypothetical protein
VLSAHEKAHGKKKGITTERAKMGEREERKALYLQMGRKK